MPKPHIKIQEYDLHLIDLRTRMPFKYGIATMTRMPQVFVRLWVEVDGRTTVGLSADLLPPKWFTKVAAKPLSEEIDEMLRVIEQALTLARGLRGAAAFDVWQQLYEAQLGWGATHQLPPLLSNFGVSLVERALIEAVCRAKETPFAHALHNGLLGLRLEAIHPRLQGWETTALLPRQPLSEIIVRHTVGLADPLTDGDIPGEERLDDSLPQSLVDCILTYGLRHFKIKVCGQLERDLDRLHHVAAIIEQYAPADFAFSLDGNEQFKTVADFRAFWQELSKSSKLGQFMPHLLFVEQPLHRDLALHPSVKAEFHDWPDRPPVIIDESDATLADLPTALQLGYAGTSHKNCKGIFKGIANRCLLEYLLRAEPGPPRLMSGEDLCNIGPVALLQDLAVMAALGISSVERNGHHYNAGLSQFPGAVRNQVLAAHSDLYHPSAAGWPTMTIEHGIIQLKTLNQSPFGVNFMLDLQEFQTLLEWQAKRTD